MLKRNILIVEDDTDLRDNIVEYLTIEGLSVAGTGNALDFYQTLSGGAFDVVIVDIGLPDRSGFEIVEHLRAKTKLGIIILTARDSMNDKLRGYELGADCYLVKPVKSARLVDEINNLLDRFGHQAQKSAVVDTADSWVLDMTHWLLVCPAGSKMELTTKEINFLQLLIAEKGNPISRQTLLQKLGYLNGNPYGSRALDVLIVRLRKKIKTVSGRTPIKTVHSVGYSFTAKAHQI